MLVIVWCYLCCCFNYCCFFQKRSGLLITSSSSSLMATFWASCSSCIEEWSAFVGVGLRYQKPRVWWKAGGISSLHIDIQTKFRIRESTLEMFQLWSTTATPGPWPSLDGINPQPKVIWVIWMTFFRCVINRNHIPNVTLERFGKWCNKSFIMFIWYFNKNKKAFERKTVISTSF